MTEGKSLQPQHIDQFRIDRVIFENDDRVVYRAFDEKENRASAVKVIDRGESVSSPAFHAWRDLRLEHPFILKFHGIGDVGGKKYVATELADGGTLDGLLNQIRASVPSGVRVSQRLRGEYVASMAQRFFDLANALDHIHRSGLNHGNLRPSNVAICTNLNQFKLTDIGVAGKLGRPTNINVRDIAYVAPELITRDGQEIDYRCADVYSMGAMLYEALTLTLPFDASDVPRYVSQLFAARPMPAANRNSSLPTDLESVIMKAIARDPGDRYQTASELAFEFQRFLTAQHVEAPGVSVSDRLLANLKKHRRTSLIVLIVIAVAGLIVFRDFLY